MMKAFGAELELVKQVAGGKPGKVTGDDLAIVENRANQLVKETKGFFAGQFKNPEGIQAHFYGTGTEIYQQTAGKVTYFGATIGSGGTFIGVTAFLKEMNQHVKSFVVEPVGAAILAGQNVLKKDHLIQGTNYAIIPHKWRPDLVDHFVQVTDDEVLDFTRRIAGDCGYFVGFSSGANVAGISKLIEQGTFTEEDTVVTILCDTGMKYLSTGLLGGD